MGEMSDDNRSLSFETPAPTKLRIGIPAGRISVVAEQTTTTRVELTARHGDGSARDWIAQAEIAQLGDEIVVRGPKLGFSLFGYRGSIDAVVHAPLGSDAALSIGAGKIETLGRMAKVSANTGAGNVHIETCSEAHANTGAGNIDIDEATGEIDVKTGAGNVKVGKVGADACVVTAAGNARIDNVTGSARMKTAHGNIDIGDAGDSLDAFTASGNVRVRRADHGTVRARTVSGEVSVGVAQGVAALLDLHTVSGRVRSELEAAGAPAEGDKRIELTLSTVSGNVSVARA
jgi:DUF4097 and DUF4098 domain-containing protein YvlB